MSIVQILRGHAQQLFLLFLVVATVCVLAAAAPRSLALIAWAVFFGWFFAHFLAMGMKRVWITFSAFFLLIAMIG